MGYALQSNISGFSENFLLSVNEFYLNKKFCDVLLENKKTKVLVHKLVLAVHSGFFRSLLESDLKCDTIVISDEISEHSLCTLVSYMYTGLVTIKDVHEAKLLLKASIEIGLSSASTILKDYLSSHDIKIAIPETSFLDLNNVVDSKFDQINEYGAFDIKCEPNDKDQDIKKNYHISKNDEPFSNIISFSDKSFSKSKKSTLKRKPNKKSNKKVKFVKLKRIPKSKYLKKVVSTVKKAKISTLKQTFWLKNGRNFFCKICCNGFIYKIGLFRHVKFKHPAFFNVFNYNLLRYKLRRSKFNFLKYSLISEEKKSIYENRLQFLCKICKKIFSLKSYCLYHISKHLKKNLLFLNVSQYKLYRQKFIKGSKNLTTKKKKKVNNDFDSKTIDNKFNCNLCTSTMVFNSEQDINSHMKSMHPDVMHKCTHCTFQTRISQVFESHLSSKHRTRKSCTLCGKSCSRTAALNLHMLLIHKVKQFGGNRKYFQCLETNCNYVCLYKKRLEEHQLKHKETKNHFCDICDKKFKHLKGLLKHKSVIHDNIRPFICDICGQAFGQESDLKTHIMSHDSNKPHACNLCSYSSRYKANLQSHLYKIHRIVMNEKMLLFSCKECSYETNRRCRYNDHIKKKHTNIFDISCTECNKMFATKQNLYGHMVAVHKPKSLICSYCSYSTSLHHSLKEHIKIMHTHRNVKNYECSLCGFRSATGGNCRKHIQRLHMNFQLSPKFIGNNNGNESMDESQLDLDESL